MKDEYYWEQVLKGSTELEITALCDVIQGIAEREKWHHISPTKKIDFTEEELDEAIQEAESLQEEFDDYKTDVGVFLVNLEDLLEDGKIEDALLKLNEGI